MTKIYNLTVLIFLITGVGCMQEDPEIGSDFFSDISFEIVTWDTLTFNLSTIQYDSIVTSAPSRLLIGNVRHDELGSIRTQTYFQLGPQVETSLTNTNNIEYEDITLTLYYDDYFYGDTTQLLELEVYLLAEEMELDDNLSLYNFSSFDILEESIGGSLPLGTISLYPRPIAKDSIEIKLDNLFGTDLFEYFKLNDTDHSNFLDLIKGINIRSKTEGAIIGFQTSPVLKIYYTDRSTSPSIKKALSFPSDEFDIQFNHIEAARDDTFLHDILNEDITSTDSGQKSFIQSGLGLAIRIEIPYLKYLLATDESLLIDKVKLELVIENQIPEEINMLPSELALYRIDKKNRLLTYYETTTGLNMDIEYGYERQYSLDITQFVEEQISGGITDNDDALMLRFLENQYNNSLDHLIISDQHGNREKSKINLNIIRIKQ